MKLWQQTIFGEPASKANQRRIVLIGGKIRVIKSAKALQYVKDFRLQVKPPETPILGDLELGVVVWYASRRPDLDVSLLMDQLQETLVVKNDRQFKIIHAYHSLDRKSPRVCIRVSKLPEDYGLPAWSES